MTIEDTRQIVSKYMPGSRMAIMYNNTPLKLRNGKLSVTYWGNDFESWNEFFEQYVLTHKQEVIDYYHAQEIIFQHKMKNYQYK